MRSLAVRARPRRRLLRQLHALCVYLCSTLAPAADSARTVAYKRFGKTRFTCGDCAGKEYAAIAGCAVLSSYLFLFIACESLVFAESLSGGMLTRERRTVYQRTYSKAKAQKSAAAKREKQASLKAQ